MQHMIHVGDDEQALAGRREGIQVVDIRHQSEFAVARVSKPGFGGRRERRLDLLDDLIGRPVPGCWMRDRVRRDRRRSSGVLISSRVWRAGPDADPRSDRGPGHRDDQQDRGSNLQLDHDRRAQDRVHQ